MNEHASRHRPKSKVPEIALGFWIIKIVATALGWTLGELKAGNVGEISSNANPNLYLMTAGVGAGVVAALVFMQINARRFDRWIYWLTFVVATVCAIAISELLQLISAPKIPAGAFILLLCFGAALFAWKQMLGEVDLEMVTDASVKSFYWITIILGQSLGFQLGESLAAYGFGSAGSAALFALLTAAIAYAHFKTSANKLTLFWAAFVLTCPLATALADFLFKPLGHGGLALVPMSGAIVLFLALVALIYILPLRSAGHAKRARSKA